MSMRRFLSLIALSPFMALALPAAAQNPNPCEDGLEVVIIPEGGGDPIYECRQLNGAQIQDEDEVPFEVPNNEGGEVVPESEIPALPDLPPVIEPADPFADMLGDDEANQSPAPDGTLESAEADEPREDIVIHSAEDRKLQLDKLFEQLAGLEDEDKANLVAEEIWAIWLQSGSASIDYILLRGTTAQASGDLTLARRKFEQVVQLSPDYAEGWVRSGRLALEEEKLGAAMADVTQSLILEPRHFYALWTLGNIFERLGQRDEAFEAYSEAHKLYPALKTVKERIEYLRQGVEGESL